MVEHFLHVNDQFCLISFVSMIMTTVSIGINWRFLCFRQHVSIDANDPAVLFYLLLHLESLCAFQTVCW
jgi:hypothetical protein